MRRHYHRLTIASLLFTGESLMGPPSSTVQCMSLLRTGSLAPDMV